MAIGDSDDRVREVALLALGTCYRGTDEVRIGRLCGAVRNEAGLALLRRAAYVALHFLRGMTTPLPPSGVGPDALFRIPEVARIGHSWIASLNGAANCIARQPDGVIRTRAGAGKRDRDRKRVDSRGGIRRRERSIKL